MVTRRAKTCEHFLFDFLGSKASLQEPRGRATGAHGWPCNIARPGHPSTGSGNLGRGTPKRKCRVSGGLNLTLKIWRQKDAKTKGQFETVKINDVSPDMSFLEMLDIVNEEQMKQGKDGFGNCTNLYECQAACPKGITVDYIAKMNREYLGATVTYAEKVYGKD